MNPISKRILSILLVVVMCLTILPSTAFAEEAADDLTVDITGADGNTKSVTLKDADSDGYYDIGNADELYAFAAAVGGGNGTINGKLTADIDLESRDWTPITNFSGTFDGAGYEIKNFAMDITAKGDYGLFGFVKDATIKDFTIRGEVESTLTASPGEEFKYGVIGDAEGSTIITDIHSYVNFTINDSNDRKFVGGILGRANNTGTGFTIERCSFNGKMNLGAAYVDCTGGIVAYVYAGNTANLNNCLFDGEILSKYGNTMQVGGMIGYYRGGDLTIKNCLSVGKIDVPNTTFAGMIGGRVLEMDTNISKVSNNYYYGTLPAFSDTENTSHSNYNKDMADYAGYGDGNARSVTDAQLKSGEIAYRLQGEQESHVWGQTIGTENYPVLNGEKVYFDESADPPYYNEKSEIISVDITWGAMSFTYTDGEWNPETHTYGEGEWTPDDGGNVITVTNNGNVDVNVTFTYDKTVAEVEGNFTDESGNAITSPFALATEEEKKIKLILNGKPSSTFENKELGIVTVSITLPKE